MRRLIAYLVLIFVLTSCIVDKDKNVSDSPYVVILSMDGFRWDYPEKANAPNLDSLESIGGRTSASITCFPTKTFLFGESKTYRKDCILGIVNGLKILLLWHIVVGVY